METAWINDAGRLLQTIGWTLIHSLWQAAIVYALLSFLLRAVPGLPARARYACGAVALGVITLWSLSTLYRHWPPATPTLTPAYSPAVSAVSSERNLLRFLDEAMPWLMMAYGLGLGLMLGRMLLGFTEIRRMRRSSYEAGPELVGRLQALAGRMGIRRPVTLRRSSLVAVPMVIGALRPVILLPPSCLETLSPAALEALLLHELAHIRRADFLVNILQTIIEAVLFFNPFVRLISALLRREREHCCDDLVISNSGHPFEYAAALASLAAAGPQPSLALAANGGRYPLLNRIKRITTMEKKSFRPGTVILVSGIAALLVALSIACFTPAFAQRKGKTANATTQPAPPAPPATHSATTAPAAPQPPKPLDPVDAPDLAAFTKDAVALGLDAADLALAKMPGLVDSAMFAATEAVRQIDWTGVRRELRSAAKELDAVDWNAINKEISTAMKESMDEIDWNEIRAAIRSVPMPPAPPAAPRAGMPAAAPEAPQSQRDRAQRMRERQEAREEMQRELAEARAELEEARREHESASTARRNDLDKARGVSERQREAARERMEEAREEMEQARREMETARKEMERARQELEKARQQNR